MFKLAAIEAIYGIWKYMNDKVFGNNMDNTKIGENIIYMICIEVEKIRKHIANLMMDQLCFWLLVSLRVGSK